MSLINVSFIEPPLDNHSLDCCADARDDLSSNWTADEHSMAYENVPVRKFSRRTFSGPSDSSPAGT